MNCIGPTARSHMVSPSYAPPSVSGIAATLPCPLSARPTMWGDVVPVGEHLAAAVAPLVGLDLADAGEQRPARWQPGSVWMPRAWRRSCTRRALPAGRRSSVSALTSRTRSCCVLRITAASCSGSPLCRLGSVGRLDRVAGRRPCTGTSGTMRRLRCWTRRRRVRAALCGTRLAGDVRTERASGPRRRRSSPPRYATTREKRPPNM